MPLELLFRPPPINTSRWHRRFPKSLVSPPRIRVIPITLSHHHRSWPRPCWEGSAGAGRRRSQLPASARARCRFWQPESRAAYDEDLLSRGSWRSYGSQRCGSGRRPDQGHPRSKRAEKGAAQLPGSDHHPRRLQVLRSPASARREPPVVLCHWSDPRCRGGPGARIAPCSSARSRRCRPCPGDASRAPGRIDARQVVVLRRGE